MQSKLLTIIIPVRAEEETILHTIAVLEKTVRTPHQILIADDTTDPRDRTIAVVENMNKLQQCHSGLRAGIQKRAMDSRLRGNDKNVGVCRKKSGDPDGFGPTLVRAARTVKTPYTLFVMADLSDDAKTIDRMVEKIQASRADCIAGCRYMRGAKKIGGPMLQGFFSTLLNTLIFIMLGFPTRDATNAFKLYRTQFLRSILPKEPATGVEFSLQLLTQAVQKKGTILDLPTVWRGREKGQSKVRLLSRGPVYAKLFFQACAPHVRSVLG